LTTFPLTVFLDVIGYCICAGNAIMNDEEDDYAAGMGDDIDAGRSVQCEEVLEVLDSDDEGAPLPMAMVAAAAPAAAATYVAQAPPLADVCHASVADAVGPAMALPPVAMPQQQQLQLEQPPQEAPPATTALQSEPVVYDLISSDDEA
jgi:hypothetical protein